MQACGGHCRSQYATCDDKVLTEPLSDCWGGSQSRVLSPPQKAGAEKWWRFAQHVLATREFLKSGKGTLLDRSEHEGKCVHWQAVRIEARTGKHSKGKACNMRCDLQGGGLVRDTCKATEGRHRHDPTAMFAAACGPLAMGCWAAYLPT